MAGVMMRIEATADRLVAHGLALRDMAARLKAPELEQLADNILDEAVVLEDAQLDIDWAVQGLRLGRQKTPNRELREREERIEILQGMRGKKKASTSRELVESLGGQSA